MKLLEEIPGYEAEEGVLGGADPVVQVDGVGVVAGLLKKRFQISLFVIHFRFVIFCLRFFLVFLDW